MHKCNAVTAWLRDHQEFTVIEWPSRSPGLNPIENLWGILINEWTDRNERTPDMCSNVITWKCTRASEEILSYASSWCNQCDVECCTAWTTGLGQNPPAAKSPCGQNPPPTKIPIRPKTTADVNSPPAERVTCCYNRKK